MDSIISHNFGLSRIQAKPLYNDHLKSMSIFYVSFRLNRLKNFKLNSSESAEFLSDLEHELWWSSGVITVENTKYFNRHMIWVGEVLIDINYIRVKWLLKPNYRWTKTVHPFCWNIKRVSFLDFSFDVETSKRSRFHI